jgi:hypothetical protein
MKTSELTGAALDWAVAKCEGYTDYCGATDKMLPPRKEYGWVQLFDLNYSTNWAQGGPIIERIKGFLFKHWLESNREGQCQAEIHNYDGDWIAFGPTPLIAAMRCYVASKLGDEVEVPDEMA